MERPSHTVMALSVLPGSRRLMGAGLSVAVQGIIVAGLIGGFVVRDAMRDPGPIEVTPFDKVASTPPPPPVIRPVAPTMPQTQMPVFTIAPPQGNGGITATLPTVPARTPVEALPPPPPVSAVPDRAASGVAATHTVPPYPTLARRLGAEGKVTLRLTVLADGSVAKAEVVGSSGRADLDQAAQAWITGHWTYSPAIRGGVPAASQVMAAVEFTLTGGK